MALTKLIDLTLLQRAVNTLIPMMAPASQGQGYAACSTAAATAAKTATLSGYNAVTGGIVAVKFAYAVPASATLNINSKGAKAIYFRGAAITADVIKAGDTATMMYDGTYYQLIAVDRWQTDIATLASRLDALVDGDEVSY